MIQRTSGTPKTFLRFAVSLLAAGVGFMGGCVTRQFGEPPVTPRSTSKSTPTSPPADVRCGVPTDAEYQTQADNTVANAFFAKEAADARWDFTGNAPWSLPTPARTQWLARALAPITLGCETYTSSGPLRYGEDSMRNALALMADLLSGNLAATILADDKRPLFSLDPFVPRSSNVEIAILRAINERLAPGGKGKFRGRGEKRIHGDPLTPDQIAFVKDLEGEGIVSLHEDDTPFANADGVMVSGTFLSYPEGARVQGLMVDWQTRARALDSSSTSAKARDETVREVSKLMLDCIFVHPFGDGNGRTCTLWGAWKLSTLGIPHALLWSGSDNYLSYQDWAKLYGEGIARHERLLEELKK
jgi:hypothetical protein